MPNSIFVPYLLVVLGLLTCSIVFGSILGAVLVHLIRVCRFLKFMISAEFVNDC